MNMPDFTKKYLPMNELVSWLVILLYPRGRSSVTCAKAVRGHVNRARRKGELTEKQKKNGRKLLEVSSFLRWISSKSVRGFNWGGQLKDKYPKLYVGITIVKVTGVSAAAGVGYVYPKELPSTLKESNDELIKSHIKIIELTTQLNRYKEKEKKNNTYKQQQRKYGKSGGRGNAK
jgi:hypothetical protein